MSKDPLSLLIQQKYQKLWGWYIVLAKIFRTLPLILPKNLLRTRCGRSCGLGNIEELF